MTDDDLPDFSGKFVSFYLTGAAASSWGDAGVIMEFLEFRRLGGRLFIVGRLPEKVGSEWLWSLKSGIAWDSVAHYIVFDSREDYERRFANAKPGFLTRVLGREAG